MGDDIPELMRLRRLRTNLDLPAYLFERYGGSCKGECETPVAIVASLPEALTCCNMHAIYDHWVQTRRLERSLTHKIQQTKQEPPKAVEAPLADRYERTFTGTYVGRKMFEEDTSESDPGDALSPRARQAS